MSVLAIQVPPALATVLNAAGDKSGVDFDYLVQTAVRESSLNPEARAQTSSAVGLFQFVEGTWLEVLKTEGPRLGYGDLSRSIERTNDGQFVIRDSGLRAEILQLREDPQMSADLAAAFTRQNGEYLTERFGRQPSPGELYIAHFMGARGAANLFDAGLENPDQIAATLFPRQAEANRSIFYGANGARTIRQVYQSLVSRHDAADIAQSAPAQTMAYAPQPASVAPVPFPAINRGETGYATGLGRVHIQSRYGPPLQGFENGGGTMRAPLEQLFNVANPASGRTNSPQSQPVQVLLDPGAAFFAQLYNQ